jgi:hypothetical protein
MRCGRQDLPDDGAVGGSFWPHRKRLRTARSYVEDEAQTLSIKFIGRFGDDQRRLRQIDEELRSSQATLDEVIEHRSPGLGGLSAHVLDREQDFLAILADADHDKQQD